MKLNFTLLLLLLSSGLIHAQDNTPPVAKAKPELTLELNADGVASLTPAQVNDGSTDNITSQANLQLKLSRTSFSCSDINVRQEWQLLGGPGISAGDVDEQSLVVGPDGTPFLAYEDIANGSRTTVLRWNGSSWLALGGPGISSGEAIYQSIAIGPDGTPYVAYKDIANGGGTTVLRWNGSSWLALGGTGISSGEANYQSIAIGADGTPFVAYQDMDSDEKTTILKWNGSNWLTLGGVGAIGRLTYFQKLVIAPDGTPFLAYADAGNEFKTSVQKWNGSSWQPVGALGISTGGTYFTKLVIAPDGTPYVAYVEYVYEYSEYRIMVHTWNGSSWEILGGPEVTGLSQVEPSLLITPNRTLFLAYRDNSNSTRTTVKKWNGSSWTVIEGGAGLPTDSDNQSLGSAPDGTLYLAYKSKIDGIFKSTVQKFYQSNRITLSVTDEAGNKDFTSTLVNVVDKLAPVVKKKDVTVPVMASGKSVLSPEMVNNGSTDNCTSPENLLYSLEGQTTFTLADIGQHSVTLKVTDASGNATSVQATVTVVNGMVPVAKAKPTVTLTLDQSGSGTLTAAEVNDGSHSRDGTTALKYSLSQTGFDCSNIKTVEEWQWMGTSGISGGRTLEQSLAISLDGTLYVAYQDNANADKTTVMKWNGSSWKALGGAGISAGRASYQSLAISPDGTPYVAYQDNANANKATVLKWNGNNWEPLGGVGISTRSASDQSLAIAPDGTPYLAFDDGNSSKATVLKWNGSSWEALGGAGISAGFAYEQSLAIAPDGTPYVTYRDLANGAETTVLMWNGNSWEPLGGVGISSGSAINHSMAIAPDGTPYVTFSDEGNGHKVTVLKWNGSEWEALGGATISAGQGGYQSLAVGPDGAPYVAYKDYANEGITTVQKWDGSAWQIVGKENSSAGRDYSLAVSPDGTPYVAFTNLDNSSKSAVQKFYQRNRVTLTVEDENGNKAIAGTLVKVVDEQAPLVKVKEISVQLNAEGIAEISAAALNDGSSDNCGITSMSLDKSTFSCAEVGAQMVKVTMIDGSGNASTATTTVTVQDNIAPSIKEGQLFTIDENSAKGTVVGTLSATDNCKLAGWAIAEGSTSEVFAVDANGVITVSNSTSLDYEATSELSLAFSVTDAANNVSTGTLTIQLNDIPENEAPVLAELLPVSGNELDLITFTVSATDENSAADLIFSLGADAPEGASMDASTGVFTWTPTELQGASVNTILVIVTDGALTDQQEIAITVNEVNEGPVVTSIPVTSAKEGEPYQYQLRATDADLPANTLVYEAVEVPSWLSFDPSTQILSGTPGAGLEAGEYAVRLKVGDGTEAVVQEFSIQLEVELKEPTGLFDKNERTSNISVYPNPTSGSVRIEMGDHLSGERVAVSLLDLEGKLLWESEGSFDHGTDKINVSLEEVKAGIYLLQVNVRGQLSFFRILKN